MDYKDYVIYAVCVVAEKCVEFCLSLHFYILF